MSIRAVEQKKSVEFTEAIYAVLEFCEEAAKHLPEGKFIEVCEKLKIISDEPSITYITEIVERVRRNEILRNHERRTKMKVKEDSVKLSDASKLKNGWKCCPKCDRIVLDINSHQFTDVCIRTADSKKVSATWSKEASSNEMEAIHKIRAIRIRNKD